MFEDFERCKVYSKLQCMKEEKGRSFGGLNTQGFVLIMCECNRRSLSKSAWAKESCVVLLNSHGTVQ